MMDDTNTKSTKKPLTLSKKIELKDIVSGKSSTVDKGRSSGKTVVIEVKRRPPGAKPKPILPAEETSTNRHDGKPAVLENMPLITDVPAERKVASLSDPLSHLTPQEREARLKALAGAMERAPEEERRAIERQEREAEAASRRAAKMRQQVLEAELVTDKGEQECQLHAQDAPTVEIDGKSATREDLLDPSKAPVATKEETKHGRDYNKPAYEKRDGNETSSSKKRREEKRVVVRSEAGSRRERKMTVTQALKDPDDVRMRSMASLRRAKEKEKSIMAPPDSPKKVYREVTLPEVITVQELSNRMSEPSGTVVKALMQSGVMVTITQTIDADTAQLVVEELGHTVRRVSDEDVEKDLLDRSEMADVKAFPRPPVVTVMGHVDHGKTSLLDVIRSSDVVKGESGGITQHIGAYQVTTKNGKKITFIDTPGHAAFTEMRARGANATDIVVLVIAADDGIKDQTVEAISHAKVAGVPIIVAINKMDKPEADPNRVRQDLLQHELIVEEMGGDILTIEVSAMKKKNIDKLEEAILLQAEIMDLEAPESGVVVGSVVEAKLEKGRGAVATVLVQKGTLRVGDIFVAGAQWGRVRALINDRGESLRAVTPATPIEIVGFNAAPDAGDVFSVVGEESRAREVAEFRDRKRREKLAAIQSKNKMENLFRESEGRDKKVLNVVVKADVQGSSEAIVSSLKQLGTDEVQVKSIFTGVGAISEADISLASAASALIIGFNVRANMQARESADKGGVEIRYYTVIYDVMNDMKALMSGLLSPIEQEEFLGIAEIREVFKVSKIGNIAGCSVKRGIVKRGSKVRLLRDNLVIHEGRLKTLKRFKDEVKEAKEGYECGMSFESYNDIRVGDLIECSELKEIQRTL